MQVTLGQVIAASQSNDVLGLSAATNRAQILDYIERSIELAINEANWQINIGTIDVCSSPEGIVTLPWFVGTVLAVNVCGQPTIFRNSWYEFHINGVGTRGNCGPQNNAACCGWGWLSDDLLWSPTLFDLKQWSYVAAICEDAIDGAQNPPLTLIVEGETMDAYGNPKMALTFPTTGPSQPGVLLPLINNYASTDQGVTPFRKITRVTKPVTRGYVKLIGFPPNQNGNAVTLGYYGPNETNPNYRRIRVDAKCASVRVRYVRAQLPYLYDYEILPVASYQSMLDLLRVVRMRETNNGDEADKMLARVIDLLTKIEVIEQGPAISPMQFEPGWGIGCIDYR